MHAAITPTQLLLWILLGFLCAWMITFAWLAFKRAPEMQMKQSEDVTSHAVTSAPAQVTSASPSLLQNQSVQTVKVLRQPIKEAVLEESLS
ncbi:MAG TPA: hypothetical protein VL461_10640 [Dictyobacter sp.]|jgi:hypothetical protein|nr:hypothetical protein [Dictyobacter sp.]